MPRFAANVAMMFNDLEIEDRFAAARTAGFRAVEYQFPYDLDPAAVRALLDDNGLEFALCNTPPGDLDAGERGLGAVPGREDAFDECIDRALDFAEAVGCPRIHTMAGVVPEGVSREACRATFVDNLARVAPRAAARSIDLLLEPINSTSMPGYFLNYCADASAIITELGQPNVWLQLDLFHAQMMRGVLADHIDRYLPMTRHMQIAGVPGRHEPDVGEINYPYLFERLDERRYEGWIGCEYNPAGDTLAGLGWYAPYRER